MEVFLLASRYAFIKLVFTGFMELLVFLSTPAFPTAYIWSLLVLDVVWTLGYWYRIADLAFSYTNALVSTF